MSKALRKVEQDQRVFTILQTQIDSQRKNVETAQIMLDEIRSIRDEVNEIKSHVGKKFEEMTEMVQEVRDSKTLLDAERFDLQSAVTTKAISLTKDRINEENEEFPKVVGKYKRLIWKHLKQHFQVPKYSHIRRIDFPVSLEFVQTFRPESYI